MLAAAAKRVNSNDPDVLRAALLRESGERRRAECRADMQTEIVKLALDLLVREPDVDGFFGALTKKMVEESESHTCGVWLIDESGAALRPVDGLREGSTVHAAQGRLGAARGGNAVQAARVRRACQPPVRIPPRLD